MIVDTSALIALFNERDPDHEAAQRAFADFHGTPIVSAYVLTEVDYMISDRLGTPTELAVLRELTSGAWELTSLTEDEISTALDVIERYADQNIGLADAANVVLADRYNTRTIATLDHRHFDVVRPLRGGRFKIVP